MTLDSRKLKQAYLCEQILNRGYNTEDFSAYLQKLKRNLIIDGSKRRRR